MGGRPVWILAFALLLAIVALASSLAGRLPVAAWGERLGDAGVVGALGLFGVGAFATSVGLPRQLVALVAGFAFGTAAGFTVALAAAIAGCALSVLASRNWLRAPVRRRFPAAVDRLAAFAVRDTFLKILVLRLQPLGTNLVSNLAAGVIRLPLRPFLGASLLGYMPQTLVFALTGSGVRVGSRVELIVAAVLFAISVVLGLVVWRRHANGDA